MCALVPRAVVEVVVVRACASCFLSEGIVGFIPLWRTVTTRESCSHTESSWLTHIVYTLVGCLACLILFLVRAFLCVAAKEGCLPMCELWQLLGGDGQGGEQPVIQHLLVG